MQKEKVIPVLVELDLVKKSKTKNVLKKVIYVKVWFDRGKLYHEISVDMVRKINKILDPWYLCNSREFAVKISASGEVLYEAGFYTTVSDSLPFSYSIFNEILGEAIQTYILVNVRT